MLIIVLLVNQKEKEPQLVIAQPDNMKIQKDFVYLAIINVGIVKTDPVIIVSVPKTELEMTVTVPTTHSMMVSMLNANNVQTDVPNVMTVELALLVKTIDNLLMDNVHAKMDIMNHVDLKMVYLVMEIVTNQNVSHVM